MINLPVPVIALGSPPVFPPAEQALRTPDGLLAVGGDLHPDRLLAAYSQGIFPWFGEGEPVLWWSPDPRCVFDTDGIHVSQSLRRQIRRSRWTLSVNRDFTAVIEACAAPRDDHGGTWIVPSMIEAYTRLHRLGHAHSVEVWDGNALVGGIYGVAVGRLFCGESMFSHATGGSKVALLGLCRHLHQHGCPLLDAQVTNDHLLSLGAREIPRADFLQQVQTLTSQTPVGDAWRKTTPPIPAAHLLPGAES
jgi:leucyl/phenylalanyl-tRNA--protein transferase